MSTSTISVDPAKRRRKRRRTRALEENNHTSSSDIIYNTPSRSDDARHSIMMAEISEDENNMNNQDKNDPIRHCFYRKNWHILRAILSNIILISFVCFWVWMIITFFTYRGQWVQLDARVTDAHFINKTCTRNNNCDLFNSNCLVQDYSCYEDRIDISLINLRDNIKHKDSFLKFYFDESAFLAEKYYKYYVGQKGKTIKVFSGSLTIEDSGCYIYDPTFAETRFNKYQKKPSHYDLIMVGFPVLSMCSIFVLILLIMVSFYSCHACVYR